MIKKNQSGRRVGDGHPNSVLSDAEVEQVLEDRGPDDDPLMTYAQLAKKWGVSKSCIAGICTGRRRGQAGYVSDTRPAKKSEKMKRVRVRLSIPLYIRAKLHMLGGSKFVENAVRDAIVTRTHDASDTAEQR